jgi:hypothetical protein
MGSSIYAGFSLVTAPVGDSPLHVPEAAQRTIMLPFRQRLLLWLR